MINKIKNILKRKRLITILVLIDIILYSFVMAFIGYKIGYNKGKIYSLTHIEETNNAIKNLDFSNQVSNQNSKYVRPGSICPPIE